jgi:hypothetical protein
MHSTEKRASKNTSLARARLIFSIHALLSQLVPVGTSSGLSGLC